MKRAYSSAIWMPKIYESITIRWRQDVDDPTLLVPGNGFTAGYASHLRDGTPNMNARFTAEEARMIGEDFERSGGWV